MRIRLIRTPGFEPQVNSLSKWGKRQPDTLNAIIDLSGLPSDCSFAFFHRLLYIINMSTRMEDKMPIAFENSPVLQVSSVILEAPTRPDAPRLIDSNAARKKLKASEVGASVGCYVFAVRKGQRHKPWYVGKATKCFSQEVFNDSNCRKYDEALRLEKTGKGIVLFVTMPKSRGAVNRKAIDKLETMLVEECGGQNPQIRNQRKSKIYRIIIHGVVNSGQGKPPTNGLTLRKMMGRD